MKKHSMRASFLIFILVLVLCCAGACSCNKTLNLGEDPLSAKSPSDAVSSADISASDTDHISETDSEITETSDTDLSETTQITETDISDTDVSPSDTTATSLTTTTSGTKATSTVSSSAPAENRNAPGVYKPNYKKKYYIVVYTGSQSVAVYGKDSDGYYNQLVKCFTCSTGTKGHETRTGLYTIWRKFRWRALVGGVYGQYNSSISKDYLFHSVPYKKKSVNALDNAEYDKLGTPASHGCIRLCVRDAKWIYDNCAIDTQVNITRDSGPAGQGVPKRNPDSKFKGWDPSDKWAKNNPYFDPSYTETATTTTTTATTTTTTATTTTTTTAAAPSSDSDI